MGVPESTLADLHVERLRRALPWALYCSMVTRLTGKTTGQQLTPTEAEAVIRALERTRLPTHERPGDRPSWRLVASVHAAGELAFCYEPQQTDAWFEREFGSRIVEADAPSLVRAVARLRAARAAQRRSTQ